MLRLIRNFASRRAMAKMSTDDLLSAWHDTLLPDDSTQMLDTEKLINLSYALNARLDSRQVPFDERQLIFSEVTEILKQSRKELLPYVLCVLTGHNPRSTRTPDECHVRIPGGAEGNLYVDWIASEKLEDQKEGYRRYVLSDSTGNAGDGKRWVVDVPPTDRGDSVLRNKGGSCRQ